MPEELKPEVVDHKRAKRRDTIGPYDPVKDGAEPKAPYDSQASRNEEGRVRTYEAGRILTIGDDFRQPGELVPEACTWFRLDNLLHTGFVISVEVSRETFDEAVQQYCPELADDIERLMHRS